MNPPESPLAPPSPTLGDGDLSLRPPTASDADRIFELCQDPLIGRFTTIPQPYVHADAIEYIADSDEKWGDGSGAPFLITLGGEVVGSIGVFRNPADLAVAEVGYWVGSDSRGHGIATRSVRLVTRWAFDAMNLARIQLGTNRANLASQRVALKSGFVFEGILREWRVIRGERCDEVHFSLLPSDVEE